MTPTMLLLASALLVPGAASYRGFAPTEAFQATGANQKAPDMSGRWVKDPEKSDDAEAKMKAAFEQMRQGRGRFGGGPPGGGGRPEGMRRRPGGPGGPGGGGPGIRQIPDEINLTLPEGELHMDDGQRVEIFYLDGEKHLRELPNGTKLETVSLVEGNAVHIQEKLEHGNIDRKLELSPDGETLVLTMTMKMGNMKDPVVIRTVYERSAEGER